MRTQILVLGGGISGLSAAFRLGTRLRNAADVTIIEKESRVGGWIQSASPGSVIFEQVWEILKDGMMFV